jgi:type VI secretion system protein ImpA
MQATELFYRAAEPSSPIPVLLSKARTYVSKDFASILSELIPREPDSNG